jgi:uncharacterized protein YciI
MPEHPCLALVLCRDDPARKSERADRLEAHRAHLTAPGSPVRLAGPLFGEGGTSAGSMLVLEVTDLAAARQFVEDDPFSRAGVFSEISIQPLRITINNL